MTTRNISHYKYMIPNEDIPLVWDGLPLLIEKILLLNDVKARFQKNSDNLVHILTEKNNKTLFEFIENTENTRGCIFTRNNIIFSGCIDLNDEVRNLFDLAFDKAIVNNSKNIFEDAKEQQISCKQLKPLFKEILPILRNKTR